MVLTVLSFWRLLRPENHWVYALERCLLEKSPIYSSPGDNDLVNNVKVTTGLLFFSKCCYSLHLRLLKKGPIYSSTGDSNFVDNAKAAIDLLHSVD